MESSVWKIKQEICEIGTKIWLKGFCAGNEGNHSVRIGENKVLITPSGISKGDIKPEMICMIDLDSNQIDNQTKYRRSSEAKVHCAIYRARPDVKAVIHSHPPHATAFAVAGINLPEAIHPEAEVFLGKVVTADYATPSTDELPNSLLPHIGPETNTLLMGNHGSVSFDTSLTGAYYKLEILDAYCRMLILTKQIGKANQLNTSQMDELLTVKEAFGMKDPRKDCVTTGCIGEQNQDFFASFGDDARPVGVQQSVGGTPSAAGAYPLAEVVATAVQGVKAQASGLGEADFEQLVQSITDQIMASK